MEKLENAESNRIEYKRELTDNFLIVTFPFAESLNNLNEGLNKTQIAILSILHKDNTVTTKILSERIGVDISTIDRNLRKLKDKNLIIRTGSKKAGQWVIVKK